MTDEMLELARRNAADISNCAINLSADKHQLIREAARVPACVSAGASPSAT